MRGPHEDLESYLEAIDQLRTTIDFFKSNKTLKSSEGVINHANNLLTKAISKLEDEFRQLLTNYRFLFCCSKFFLIKFVFFCSFSFPFRDEDYLQCLISDFGFCS